MVELRYVMSTFMFLPMLALNANLPFTANDNIGAAITAKSGVQLSGPSVMGQVVHE